MADPPFDAQQGVRRTTVILLVIIILLVIWYVVSDRLTPYSSVARVKAYVIAVVPDVSGYLEKVPVKKNQLVGPGDTLLQVERKRFTFALKENLRGRFLRVTEDVGGRRDTIIIPATGLEEFREAFEHIMDANDDAGPCESFPDDD